MLTSLLPPAVCASCRLCCNFLPESVWECPALEPACADELRARGVCLVERPEGGETIRLPFDPECPHEAVNCPLLDTSSGCILPRAQRPLECRLWPLRLMRDSAGQIVLAYYHACPGLAEMPREKLLEVAESLRPQLMRRVAEYPASIRPLHPNYTILFSLNDSLALPREVSK